MRTPALLVAAILVAVVPLTSDLPAVAQQPPGTADLKPFSPRAGFMSQAGYRRLLASELAPTGRLRVAFIPNPLLISRNPATGEMRGVSVDLARELAARAGVPYAPLDFGTLAFSQILARIVEGATTGAWDVAFIGIVSPGRTDIMGFTAPYAEIESTFLVRAGVTIRAVSDADRPGIRIAAIAGSAFERILEATLQHAQLVRVNSPAAGIELLRSGRADVYVGLRGPLIGFAAGLPGSRVLLDRFSVEGYGIAVPRGRTAALGFVREFVEWAKASGFMRQAIERAGVRGVQVAPAAAVR